MVVSKSHRLKRKQKTVKGKAMAVGLERKTEYEGESSVSE